MARSGLFPPSGVQDPASGRCLGACVVAIHAPGISEAEREGSLQGRTVDTVITAMKANHPNLTPQRMLYVEVSRERDRAELVTEDRVALREQREAATGQRNAALEAVGPDQPRSSRSSGRRPEARRTCRGEIVVFLLS